MGAPRDFTHTFAGAGTVEVLFAGRYIRILEAPTSALFIRISAGSELKRVAGQEIDSGQGGFTRFSIRSAVAQTILVVVSDTPQDDNQTAITATVTATITAGDTLTSAIDAAVAGVTTAQVLAGRTDRVSVIVKNLNANTDPIRVGDSLIGAARGHELMPGESISLDCTSTIFVYNSKVTAQSVSILEVRDV